MGVSGSGKTTVGEMLASEIKAKFIDGDDLHPRANILKMANGEALNDEDRAPWLERIRDALFSLQNKNEIGVIVCSALKKKYRKKIREGNENILFVYLEGTIETIISRISERSGHFMKANLVSSQFEALESPVAEPDVLTINIDQDINDIIRHALCGLNRDNKMLNNSASEVQL
jgi:gluconokinase